MSYDSLFESGEARPSTARTFHYILNYFALDNSCLVGSCELYHVGCAVGTFCVPIGRFVLVGSLKEGSGDGFASFVASVKNPCDRGGTFISCLAQ